MDANNNMSGEKSIGPVVALIIILAVIILGGLYFWGQRTNNSTTDIYGNPINQNAGSSADTSAIDAQSSSDTSASIQSDLNNTDTTNLDSQLNGS